MVEIVIVTHGVVRRRIDDFAPKARAELSAVLIQRAAERDLAPVDRDILCLPHGISLHGIRLAVADPGDGPVLPWSRS